MIVGEISKMDQLEIYANNALKEENRGLLQEIIDRDVQINQLNEALLDSKNNTEYLERACIKELRNKNKQITKLQKEILDMNETVDFVRQKLADSHCDKLQIIFDLDEYKETATVLQSQIGNLKQMLDTKDIDLKRMIIESNTYHDVVEKHKDVILREDKEILKMTHKFSVYSLYCKRLICC